MKELARLWNTPLFTFKVIQEMISGNKIHFSEEQYPSQTGKTWVVTGSTAGIGFVVATELAKLGAHVWLVGRNQQKVLDCIEQIKSEVPHAVLNFMIMDFADLKTIGPGVAAFLKTNTPVHGIIHNAGVMLTPASKKTVQGHEMQLGVNCLASWLLQKYLDEALLQGSTTSNPGRIVWVASLGHFGAPYHGEYIAKDPAHCLFHGEAYPISKAVNIMESIQWTQAHPHAPVKSVSVHPGVIKSDLTREMSSFGQKIVDYLAWPTNYGAITELAAALADVPNNSYVVPFGQVSRPRQDLVDASSSSLDLSQWLDSKVDQFFSL